MLSKIHNLNPQFVFKGVSVMTIEPKVTINDLPESLRNLSVNELFLKTVKVTDKNDTSELSLVDAVKILRYLSQDDINHTGAQVNLGVCYFRGNGVEQDSTKAFEWQKKAAEQGNPVAQNNLAFCYINGKGVSLNLIKGLKYHFAAVAGHGEEFLANFEYPTVSVLRDTILPIALAFNALGKTVTMKEIGTIFEPYIHSLRRELG
jgi:hypothetical protein